MSGTPLSLVEDWFGEAVSAGLPEPSAMALATATGDGAPSVRFLLLKGIDDAGVHPPTGPPWTAERMQGRFIRP